MTLKKYNLTIEEYRQNGVWETNQTRAAGLSVDEVLEEMVNANFVSVYQTFEDIINR